MTIDLPTPTPILAGEEEDETSRPPPGKGRAYITYAKLTELGNLMTSTLFKVDELGRTLTRGEVRQQEHEARIRALELFQAATLAAKTASSEGKQDVRWTLERVMGLIALLASIGAVLLTLAKH